MPTENQGSETTTDSGIEETEIEGIDSEQPEADATEQADTAQDPNADAEGEEGQELVANSGLKDPKSGNYDWKKISEKIGSPELERVFKDSERKITQISQENKTLREQAGQVEAFREKASELDYFAQLLNRNPALKAQVQAAINGVQQPQAAPRKEIQLPEGVHPNDPLAPLVLKLMEGQSRFEQQSQQVEAQQRQQRDTENFRQGLIAAKGRFKAETGLEMTEQQMRTVAENMQKSGFLRGDLLVPGLFSEEIKKSIERKFHESRKVKKGLPKTPVGGRGNASSAKTMKQAFDEAWEKEQERG